MDAERRHSPSGFRAREPYGSRLPSLQAGEFADERVDRDVATRATLAPRPGVVVEVDANQVAEPRMDRDCRAVQTLRDRR